MRISGSWIALLGLLVLSSALRPDALAREARGRKKSEFGTGPERVLILDGTIVHNIGRLQMHLLNWGEWGSRPDSGEPYSFSPSAQWPAGSGVEYVYTAGLWVGAVKNGIPSVSTATLEREFRPSADPRDRIYKTHEGAEHGLRYPSVRADDDGDGLVDEDRLDGFDNDGDGQVDEDFAAISRLMYSCRYTDREPVSREIYPEHNPLDILVTQESYQWDGERFDDFICIEYQITNVGRVVLEDVFIGMFVDGDAGSRSRGNYWEDDMTGYRDAGAVCTESGPVLSLDAAYTYDADGDEGETTGYFGVLFVNHPTDVTGELAPTKVGITTYAHFSGYQTFSLGGDPTNDFERYELLSQRSIERDSDFPRDYRMLVAGGPFRTLPPESTLVVQMAFAIGEGVEGLLANGAMANVAYQGANFDIDGDPMTGIDGRESVEYGPQYSVWVDKCRKPLKLPGGGDPFYEEGGCDAARQDDRFRKPIPILAEGEELWVNADCDLECVRKAICGYTEEDSLTFRTGVGGRETTVRWIIATAPPPPNMRLDDHARDGVVVYWDNLSEVVRDTKTQRFDFEAYQLWRADNWTRPLGTSVITGPPEELWTVLLQADVINRFGQDVGLEQLRYEPLLHELAAVHRQDFLQSMMEYLRNFPEKSPPCPPGVTDAICDTLEALARWELDLPGGRQYYRYVDARIQKGRPYFYAVIAVDHDISESGTIVDGQRGDPAANFVYVEPKSATQPPFAFDENEVYVVPNPATRETMDAWRLDPTNHDPSGVKVEFRNLPPAEGVVRVYTVAGDLVQELPFDARHGGGTVRWDLVSRNGQDIASGVYIFAVEFRGGQFKRVIGKFTVVR